MRRVLFYRKWKAKFGGSNGGNLKVRDCYNHVASTEDIKPEIFFSPETVWNDFPGNHWLDLRSHALSKWEMHEGDVCFFSGGDWRILDKDQRKHPPVPIINIAQPRHVRSEDPRHRFLSHPAIRIVKSENGARILENHGVNGPIYVVPDAIDLGILPKIEKKDIDVLVIGLKQPQLAQKVYESLVSWSDENQYNYRIEVQLPPKLPTRLDFLSLLGRAKIAVCIPLSAEKGEEGFYLPPLEAMAMQTMVITSHAIGNVDHCIDGQNCMVCPVGKEEYVEAAKGALLMEDSDRQAYLREGLAMAQKHSIAEERKKIVEIIRNAYAIWSKYFE